MATILVIDDDRNILELLTEGLSEAGYAVIAKFDGAEALEELSKTAVDLVVTDILMPGKDGMAVISYIKSYYPAIKIIAISGGGRSGPESYLPLAKLLGADLVEQKPFTAKIIIEDIEKLLVTSDS